MKVAVTALLTLGLLAGCAWWPPYELEVVPAAAETDPMIGAGDFADDPALWVHPTDRSQSLILGTHKLEGLYVYGLDGKERQRLTIGRINNVDVRGDLAVASNDQVNGLSWFRARADADGAVVEHIGDTLVERFHPYGICLGIIDSSPVAAVTYTDGTLELWEGSISPVEAPAARLLRTVHLDSQLEGCVFDDEERRLFIGEENHGLWVLDVADEKALPQEVDTIAAGNGLVEDVEGISLYVDEDGAGYIIVSAQAANRYVLYERQPPYAVVGGFRINRSKDGTVDRVTHTDGVDATSAMLPGFPRGLLIVQDDANPMIEKDQNFKLVDWREIENAIDLPVRQGRRSISSD